MTTLRKLLAIVVEVRAAELRTSLLMFTYGFFVMAAYNLVKPVTRSAFITDLGADNIPYGLLAGLLMQAYARIEARLPERWALPLIQVGATALLVVFWGLFQTGARWVSAGFYFFGLIFGTLVLSQFWALANEIYDPRQARRLFGFIGGGAGLGGTAGAGLAALIAVPAGADSLLLVSAVTLVVAAGVVITIIRLEGRAGGGATPTTAGRSAGLAEGLALLRESPNLRQIALLIGFAALGAVIIDQQLNMAAEQFSSDADSITRLRATVLFLLSASAFVIQILLVKQIYRLLGVGFALLTLPLGVGATGLVILISGALSAAALASVVDKTIRYTVDRTTREIFFLPLPSVIRRGAKSFVDVTVDRSSRAAGGVLLLLLIKPWGLSLDWPQLSVVSLALVSVWFVLAFKAKDRYVLAIRKGLEEQAVARQAASGDAVAAASHVGGGPCAHAGHARRQPGAGRAACRPR